MGEYGEGDEQGGAEPKINRHHRLAAVRAHLWEMVGDLGAARAYYEIAARTTTSPPEQRYLQGEAERVGTG